MVCLERSAKSACRPLLSPRFSCPLLAMWQGRAFSELPYSERQSSPHPFCKSTGQAHMKSTENNIPWAKFQNRPAFACRRTCSSKCPVWATGRLWNWVSLYKKVTLYSGRQETVTQTCDVTNFPPTSFWTSRMSTGNMERTGSAVAVGRGLCILKRLVDGNKVGLEGNSLHLQIRSLCRHSSMNYYKNFNIASREL